jgi:hypothetical protein
MGGVVVPVQIGGVRRERLPIPLAGKVRPLRRSRVAEQQLPGDRVVSSPPPEIRAEDAIVTTAVVGFAIGDEQAYERARDVALRARHQDVRP